ncbi:BREX system ATP-binding protein BrxD [Microvenator marinus]|uniref:BREX system ATP-binding protein BrxD n=1 Tax=Microvenator marinus TaxID=2600177 RepID=A0A5B8XR76_9DELT|nr:BREX system ATP-binding protein BrxD [Microvenator marinus]QED28432.1 BREX system ATP-binding protein BrxD [Microvenator marinus]
MSALTQRDVDHIFEKLRTGVVPERGIDTFAVGIDRQRNEIKRQLELIERGEGQTKFLRGGYGCGKTFMAKLAQLEARNAGYATSFVVVSDNDLRFHKFDEVYRKIMSELGTSMCERGAFNDILDRWIYRVEEQLIDAGADENARDFDDKVRARIKENLNAMSSGKAPADLIRVVQTIFDFKQRGESAEAGSLLSWLCGSSNVSASAKKAAGIRGNIESKDAMDYLRGVLEIVKASGYKGLVVIIDEVETILRVPNKTSRGKSLNGIRQIVDIAGSYPGMLWIFTGTPEFFDTTRGVCGLAPLHDRIRFTRQGTFANMRQPQIELVPFDEKRLKEVSMKLRELYPAKSRGNLEEKISEEFIDRLVDEVTKGFKKDVGIVPRQYLRQLVEQMDIVEQNPEFNPMKEWKFEPVSLSLEEESVIEGNDAGFDPDEEPIPVMDVF